MKATALVTAVSAFILGGIISPDIVAADTTPFRSAQIITTDGATPYTNLGNCSVSDGATCDRASASSFANLNFRKFGTYADFGMPNGSMIHHVRVRVTGKVSTPIYVGLSGGKTFTSNCQFPSDLWTLTLLTFPTIVSQTFVTPVVSPVQPATVDAHCLLQVNVDTDNFVFRINYSSAPGQPWSANIDNLEIAFDYNAPVVTPTPTDIPTPTATPTPAGPAPFLDLPWDYEGKGMSFTESALSINSYFDHSYPLLSSGFSEPNEFLNQTTRYDGNIDSSGNQPYSSHDGYDYGKSANARFGYSVLAAASGSAQYINSCRACGNMIEIDHGNGYQTRYLHLQKDGLITTISGKLIQVDARQMIGKVGATGNVSPVGTAGAHIHFGVVEDKDHDGNFDDNIPDGMTDPFGWQSKDPDPWEQYTFKINDVDHTGNKSYYLWKKKIDNLDATLTANGGIFASGKTHVQFDPGTTNQNLSLHITSEPQTSISRTLESIGSTLSITLQNPIGEAVTLLTKPMLLSIDFGQADLSRFKIGTFSIYSSTDSANWVQENSFTDYLQNKTSATVSHLTHFALVGELADTIPPTTTATVNGIQGQPNWYRSDVQVALDAIDNPDGLGVDYTMVRYDEGEWDNYNAPITFTTEGKHTVEFYSADNAGNIENLQTITFTIDKTLPEVLIKYDTPSQDIVLMGTDTASDTVLSQTNSGRHTQTTITDKAGNTLVLDDIDRTHGSNATISVVSLAYNDAMTPLDANKLSVRYSTDSNGIKAFKQTYVVRGVVKMELTYDSTTDVTTVTTDKQKTQVNGIRILQLTTSNGTVQYSY